MFSKTSNLKNTFDVKIGLAEMLRGGVIMYVATPEQARIAEDSGAVAVAVLSLDSNSVIGYHRNEIKRMASPEVIESIQEAVTIPVMAQCRIGHFAEAQILEALFVDFIIESELLTPVDQELHIDKHAFRIPFLCGYKDLGEALGRITEGAAILRTKGEAGFGNIAETVRYLRGIQRTMKRIKQMDRVELVAESQSLGASVTLMEQIAESGKLPVPNFASGGISTPADAALMMQLGAESVFVDFCVFNSENPMKCAQAIVRAVNYYQDPEMLAQLSKNLLNVTEGF